MCCDGTGNNKFTLAKPSDTNIFKTLKSLPASSEWLGYYIDGLGTDCFYEKNVFQKLAAGRLPGISNLSDQVVARSLDDLLAHAYDWLCEHYPKQEEGQEACKLYIFGFSRGAFLARVLARFVADVGLLSKDVLEADAHKHHAAFKVALAKWKEGKGEGSGIEKQHLSGHREINEIEVLGVWDTVSSKGLAANDVVKDSSSAAKIFGLKPDTGYDFTKSLSPKIRRCFHAIAAAEHRKPFGVDLYEPARGRTDQLVQVIFPFYHSSTGGGHDQAASAGSTEVANTDEIALVWMLAECKQYTSLEVNDNNLKAQIKPQDVKATTELQDSIQASPRNITGSLNRERVLEGAENKFFHLTMQPTDFKKFTGMDKMPEDATAVYEALKSSTAVRSQSPWEKQMLDHVKPISQGGVSTAPRTVADLPADNANSRKGAGAGDPTTSGPGHKITDTEPRVRIARDNKQDMDDVDPLSPQNVKKGVGTAVDKIKGAASKAKSVVGRKDDDKSEE